MSHGANAYCSSNPLVIQASDSSLQSHFLPEPHLRQIKWEVLIEDERFLMYSGHYDEKITFIYFGHYDEKITFIGKGASM